MSYSTRNSFYLRISKDIVLPVYVYLDERHVTWMSDVVLQHVLSDLRPRILSKLQAEADNLPGGNAAQKKSSTVDTHRGETYQLCYFIRTTEPHSVLIKSRSYHAAPKPSVAPVASPKMRGKRKETSSSDRPRSKKRKMQTQLADEDIEIENPNDYSDEMDGSPSELQIEEEEEKPKPVLGLRYQGFSIYGQCLCIVVEPWPIQRATIVAPVFAETAQASSDQVVNRASTPLFLPDEPESSEWRALADTPKRSQVNQAYLDLILNESEVSADEDIVGMMELSQILHNIGDSLPGAINDDEDVDESVLFGDADEVKEL